MKTGTNIATSNLSMRTIVSLSKSSQQTGSRLYPQIRNSARVWTIKKNSSYEMHVTYLVSTQVYLNAPNVASNSISTPSKSVKSNTCIKHSHPIHVHSKTSMNPENCIKYIRYIQLKMWLCVVFHLVDFLEEKSFEVVKKIEFVDDVCCDLRVYRGEIYDVSDGCRCRSWHLFWNWVNGRRKVGTYQL